MKLLGSGNHLAFVDFSKTSLNSPMMNTFSRLLREKLRAIKPGDEMNG